MSLFSKNILRISSASTGDTVYTLVKDIERLVLFVDNLTAHQTNECKKFVSDLKGVVWYGLKNTTDVTYNIFVIFLGCSFCFVLVYIS